MEKIKEQLQKIIKVDEERINSMMDDIVKFITIIIVVHLLSFLVDKEGGFFDEKTLKLLLYVTIALCIHHIVIKKIIQ